MIDLSIKVAGRAFSWWNLIKVSALAKEYSNDSSQNSRLKKENRQCEQLYE